MISFRPDEAEIGERIDVVLAKRAGITRTHAQRALRSGSITVSGTAVRSSHRLEVGDLIEGELPRAEMPPPLAEDIPVRIAYSDERVLCVSKPPGLVTHPARGHESGTLINALLALGEPLSGEGSTRPGIVHRLDKDTSGLLVVAKDDAAHAFLVERMRRREIDRRYVALIRGRLSAITGTLEAPVGRHPVRRRLMAVVAEGRPAVTHYRELAHSDELSLIELRLETGRTHQIRVHLSHFGHPILGDRTYGGASESAKALGLTRFFLHAWKLAFPHPEDGRLIEVDDPLPPDLASVLEAAGLPTPQP